jgi:multisubunit Na+/H+ antiporter MnhG subunit
MARNLFVFAVAFIFVIAPVGVRFLVEVIGHQKSEREAVDKHAQREKRLSDVAEKLKVFHGFVFGV